MSVDVLDAAWRGPGRQGQSATLAEEARPLVLVAEEVPVLMPMVEDLCGFLRVRAMRVVPGALADALREHRPVGVLCHAERTDGAVVAALRAVVAIDPGIPVMVVTERDPSREARLAVAAEILRLEHLLWLEHLPTLRRMVDFLFLAERRVRKGAPAFPLMPQAGPAGGEAKGHSARRRRAAAGGGGIAAGGAQAVGGGHVEMLPQPRILGRLQR